MGIGCSQRGSGALWLASIALGMDVGLALVYPSWLRAVSIHLSSPEVPTPRGLLSSLVGMGIVISVSLDT